MLRKAVGQLYVSVSPSVKRRHLHVGQWRVEAQCPTHSGTTYWLLAVFGGAGHGGSKNMDMIQGTGWGYSAEQVASQSWKAFWRWGS